MDRKQFKIVHMKLILTLYNANHFLETANIDNHKYVHLTDTAKIKFLYSVSQSAISNVSYLKKNVHIPLGLLVYYSLSQKGTPLPLMEGLYFHIFYNQ